MVFYLFFEGSYVGVSKWWFFIYFLRVVMLGKLLMVFYLFFEDSYVGVGKWWFDKGLLFYFLFLCYIFLFLVFIYVM